MGSRSHGGDGGRPAARGGAAARRATQRSRIVSAMLRLAAADGYGEVSIARVIAAAGVSRPTFYEYFADRDACFLAVLRDAADRWVATVEPAVDAVPAASALDGAVDGLFGFLAAEPERARVLMAGALEGGPAALDVRDQAIERAAAVVEGRLTALEGRELAPDVPVAVLLGGVQRLLASRLRRGGPGLEGLAGELKVWVSSYRRAVAGHRWRSLEPGPAPAPSRFVTPLLPPAPLPPGRPRLSAEQVVENHRQRLLFAAAEVSEEVGVAATTMAAVARRAGVDGRVLHGLFADKQVLFVAMHELHFQRVMSVTASAFFTGAVWPERVWQAGVAFAAAVEESSTLATVSFVESYAGGPVAQERVEVVVGAFGLFLQEGYQYRPDNPSPPSAVAIDVIALTIFEIVYRQTRRSPKPDIAGLLGHAVFLALAPFLGAADADRFVMSRPHDG